MITVIMIITDLCTYFTIGMNSPLYQAMLSQIGLDPNSKGKQLHKMVNFHYSYYVLALKSSHLLDLCMLYINSLNQKSGL